MGTCITKEDLHCPKCKRVHKAQIFQDEETGKYDAYFFSCQTTVDDPYADKPVGYKPSSFVKTPEQIREEIAIIRQCGTADIPDRKLKAEYLKEFGVKVGLSEADGTTPHTYHFPYTKKGKLSAYKTRLIAAKKMWSVGDQKDCDLFNWYKARKAGGRTLYITEGEFDAVALYQCLKDNDKGTQYAGRDHAVVSLAHGAAKADKDVAVHLTDILATWKDVVLVFDMDDAGDAAAAKVATLIPHAKRASLPAKDANACLMEGRGKALFAACVFNASVPKNSRLVAASSIHEKSKEPPKFGVSWPWANVTKLTRGIRKGETTYIGAAAKMG